MSVFEQTAKINHFLAGFVAVVGALLDRIGRLESFPESGRIVPEFDDPCIRELIRKPCRVIYRLKSHESRSQRGPNNGLLRNGGIIYPTGLFIAVVRGQKGHCRLQSLVSSMCTSDGNDFRR